MTSPLELFQQLPIYLLQNPNLLQSLQTRPHWPPLTVLWSPCLPASGPLHLPHQLSVILVAETSVSLLAYRFYVSAQMTFYSEALHKAWDPKGKSLLRNAGDVGNSGLMPGLGRSTAGRNGSRVQQTCLRNPRDRGA